MKKYFKDLDMFVVLQAKRRKTYNKINHAIADLCSLNSAGYISINDRVGSIVFSSEHIPSNVGGDFWYNLGKFSLRIDWLCGQATKV